MIKWEYMTWPVDFLLKNEYRAGWNDHGHNGWELVTVDNGVGYFKRQVKS